MTPTLFWIMMGAVVTIVALLIRWVIGLIESKGTFWEEDLTK